MNADLPGLNIAIVKDNTPDAEGRILVVLNAGSSKAGDYPARMLSMLAGDGRGLQFLPEKGDMVLVGFLAGASGEPVVMGGLWSRKSKPPEGNSNGKNDVKLIKTRGGNLIRLTDTQGSEKIEIITPNQGKITIQGSQITLDGDVKVTGQLVVGRGPTTTIKGNEITGGS